LTTQWAVAKENHQVDTLAPEQEYLPKVLKQEIKSDFYEKLNDAEKEY